MNVSEHRFTTWDGAELFYRAWMPEATSSPRRAVLLFHRGHEHSGRWQRTAERLVDRAALEDTAIFAWDQRGHGLSPGDRGGAPSIAALTRDADCFARHVAAAHGVPTSESAVLAHSVGAVVATAWLHDFAPPIRGIVLAAPAFRVKLYVPLALTALRLRQRVLGPGEVKSYVKAKMLTHDAQEAAAYAADPLIFRQIAVNVLLDLHDTSTRLMKDAAAITAPTLILAAGDDWIVTTSAQRRFFERLGSVVKQFELYATMRHAMFHESDSATVVDRAGGFLAECFSRPRRLESLQEADRGGPTRTEHDCLRLPSSLRWRAMRGALRTFGPLSDGMKLGLEHGFDSGVMLDYVYRNRAAGKLGIGRLVDRVFLDAPGWKGIRVRRANLEAMLLRAIAATRRESRPVRILDIAAGAGRYVLETLHRVASTNGGEQSATLRDYRPANLEEAQRLATELRLEGVRIEHGDAFDRASLAAVAPQPTIAIASGIYELFSDNARVLESLRGLADALPSGARLLYTGQPWHPQLEFIARVLTTHEGQPWAMRRRTQEELDELVRAAGFVKLEQTIDDAGIFSVSMACKA